MMWTVGAIIISTGIIISCIICGAYINIKSYFWHREMDLFREELNNHNWK